MASISVPQAFTSAQNEMIAKFFKQKVAARDAREVLIDQAPGSTTALTRELVRAGKQPVTIELHGPGDRKTIEGIVYELDQRGCWIRVGVGM